MAFDGITLAALTCELKNSLVGAHIKKIAQPEPDELLLTVQTPAAGSKKRETLRLKLSANASLPLIHLTGENKTSPLSAPNFCMLLRKHISGALISDITQEGLERILRISLSTKNELGDDVTFSLITEMMGKHSNIIFVDESDVIIDSIKHVNSLMSSVREVLPGKPYFIVNTLQKHSPFSLEISDWNEEIFKKPCSVAKALSGSITGMSMCMAHELCYRANTDGDAPTDSLGGNARSAIMEEFRSLISTLNKNSFEPVIYYKNDMPFEFSAVELSMYDGLKHDNPSSISEVIERYYSEKETLTRINSKSASLRTTVQNNLERNIKKISILEKQLKDTEKKDKHQLYGELITTYGYTNLPALPIPPERVDGSAPTKLICTDYHTGKELEIPIDPTLSVADNANRYYEKYSKAKRTLEAVTTQLEEAHAEREHLESVMNELSLARAEQDLTAIRNELSDQGYIKSNQGKKRNKNLPKSEPLHFISSDGYDIYVGKNNYQNDELTFKLATGNDWWFHAKKMPGSHVILKAGDTEPPQKTFEEAACLAAVFSKGNAADKLEIDYVQKKHVKKPHGSKPGFVVYYTNYSMMASMEYKSGITPCGPDEEAYL